MNIFQQLLKIYLINYLILELLAVITQAMPIENLFI